MPLRRIAKLLGLAVVALVVLLILGFVTGVLGLPSVQVDDPGDWGNVSDNQTKVMTTLSVSNPNPFGVTIGDGFSAEYAVELDGVRLIMGQRDSISIPSGQSTKQLVSTIDNDRIVPWWRAYVRNNETIDMRATGQAHVSAMVSKTIQFPAYEQTLLQDEQPVIDAFSGAVSSMEGRYTRSVAIGTVGYEIQEASATWGNVSQNTTQMDITIRIHNPGDVPVPLVPDGFRLSAEANGIELFSAQREAISARNVDGDTLLAPGATRTVTFEANLSNNRINDWFISHVRNDEQTNLTVTPQLVFEVGETGSEFTIPEEGAGYTCQFQTALLIDDQETATTCGSGGGLGR